MSKFLPLSPWLSAGAETAANLFIQVKDWQNAAPYVLKL
jgi:hypothetical protein